MPALEPEPSPDVDIKQEDTIANGDDKPRLTEVEKKANHIASEQKRRQAIRQGFDRLTELVPGLEGQGRSEGIVLSKTVDFIKEQIEERKRLIKELEERGVVVDDKDKLPKTLGRGNDAMASGEATP